MNTSRTDAGVHALCQLVNFRIKNSIPTSRIAAALNSCLPEEIRIIKAEAKAKGFHARYSPKTKEYEYLIYNGKILPPFFRKFVWHVKLKLDLAAMRKAAKILRGKHDFSSFCASGSDDKNFVRTIKKLEIRNSKLEIWAGSKVPVVSIRVIGNGFLYKMVRNMVGTLVEVGLGKLNSADVKNILHRKDRRSAGRTAPAHGLCLVQVNY